MSVLLVDQLTDTNYAEQKFRIKKSVSLAHIRPWVYLQGTLPDGDFRCRVYQGATLLKTATINYTAINSAKSLQYAHGYIRFDFDALALHLDESAETTEYILRFDMVGHTASNTNFLGIVREWDLKSTVLYGTGTDINNQALNDSVEPYGFQLYSYKKG